MSAVGRTRAGLDYLLTSEAWTELHRDAVAAPLSVCLCVCVVQRLYISYSDGPRANRLPFLGASECPDWLLAGYLWALSVSGLKPSPCHLPLSPGSLFTLFITVLVYYLDQLGLPLFAGSRSRD